MGTQKKEGNRVSFSDDMIIVPTHIHDDNNDDDDDVAAVVDKEEDGCHDNLDLELDIDDIESNKKISNSSRSSSDEDFDSPLLSFTRRLSAELISKDEKSDQ